MTKSEELLRDVCWARLIEPQSFTRLYWIELHYEDQSITEGWEPLLTLIEWALVTIRAHEATGLHLISVTLLREDDPMPLSETKSDS